MNFLEGVEEQEWPQHANSRDFVELDEAARCSICHDFYNTPLNLLCGHSFCAECIRTNIQFQERHHGKASCPQCREPADSRHIFANHPLRDLVNRFLAARPHLILATASCSSHPAAAAKRRTRPQVRAAAQNGGSRGAGADAGANGRTVIDLDSDSDAEASGRQLRKRKKSVEYYPEPETDASDTDDAEQSQSSASSPSPSPVKPRRRSAKKQRDQQPSHPGKLPANWAQCPCCNQSFPMVIFNDHLDRCVEIEGRGEGKAGPKVGGTAGPADRSLGKRTAKPRLVVPPKLLLAIEKDKSLRDRLKKYGLPIKGSRQELEQRYTRFRVEVQTALDRCEAGATYTSLARRILQRENSETHALSNGPGSLAGPPKRTAPVAGSNFNDLIKATRQRTAARKNSSELVSLEDEPEQASREDARAAENLQNGSAAEAQDGPIAGQGQRPAELPGDETRRFSRGFGPNPGAKVGRSGSLPPAEGDAVETSEGAQQRGSGLSVAPDSDAEQSGLPSLIGHQPLQEGNAVEQPVKHSDWQPGKKHIVPWSGGGSAEVLITAQDPGSD